MPSTPKPVVVWPIGGRRIDDNTTKVVLKDGWVTVEMPCEDRLGDDETTLLYQSLTAARRARRTGVLNLK